MITTTTRELTATDWHERAGETLTAMEQCKRYLNEDCKKLESWAEWKLRPFPVTSNNISFDLGIENGKTISHRIEIRQKAFARLSKRHLVQMANARNAINRMK